MIREIVNVAGKFYEGWWPPKLDAPIDGPNKSLYALMKETGCLEKNIQINENDIYDELIKCPECIAKWLDASADQRDRDTWGFLATTNGRYVVSRLANEKKNRLFQQTIFTDGYKACANFLINLIEYYRESVSR